MKKPGFGTHGIGRVPDTVDVLRSVAYAGKTYPSAELAARASSFALRGRPLLTASFERVQAMLAKNRISGRVGVERGE